MTSCELFLISFKIFLLAYNTNLNAVYTSHSGFYGKVHWKGTGRYGTLNCGLHLIQNPSFITPNTRYGGFSTDTNYVRDHNGLSGPTIRDGIAVRWNNSRIGGIRLHASIYDRLIYARRKRRVAYRPKNVDSNSEKKSEGNDSMSLRRKRLDDGILSARDPKKTTKELTKYQKLLSDIKSWGESDDKDKRDISEFILDNLKGYPLDQPVDEITPQDILEMLEEQFANEDERESDWKRHIDTVEEEVVQEFESSDLRPVYTDVSKTNLETLASDDKCGFRFPITGTPDEIYSDENIYKSWGRTLLYPVQYTNITRIPYGSYNDTHLDLEDLMVSTSPLVDKNEIKTKLEDIHHQLFNNTLNKVIDETKFDTNNVKDDPSNYRYRYANVGNSYKILKNDLLAAKAERQNEILRILNPYNPWDEYIRIKKTKESSLDESVGVNYKVKLSDNISVGIDSKGSDYKVPSNFISDYLHYFLILEKDKEMIKEFKDGNFIHDILRYFDTFVVYKEPKKEEFKDAQDRFFKFLFPSLDGFPKPPEEGKFPITLTPNKEIKDYRVNILGALVALERCHSIIAVYESDIFSEQRFGAILKIIHTALELELKRIDYGIVEMELLDVDDDCTDFCKVDGSFLAALSATLGVWNIKKGIEGIIELIMLLTLKNMHNISSDDLVVILFNISNLNTLPRSIFIKFLSKAADFIHDKLREDILTSDLDEKDTEFWMNYETASNMLNLFVRYKGIFSPEFVSNYIHLYKRQILESFKREHVDKDRKAHDMCSLLIAIETCSLSDQFESLINALSMDFYFQHLDFTSTSATTILNSFSDRDELQRLVIQRAKRRLMELKYKMSPSQILDVLDIYFDAINTSRIQPDPIFIAGILKDFTFLKRPKTQELVRAASTVEKFSPYLTKKHLEVIFDDFTTEPFVQDVSEDLGLYGEYLKYPLASLAKVLESAAKSKIIVMRAWKDLYTLIIRFKHVITVDDALVIMESLNVANFCNVDEICDVLIDRICNIVEVKEDVDYAKVFRAMEESIKLHFQPVRLLRWLIYASIYDIDKMDKDAVVDELFGKKMEYDVDFRGWKRPVTTDEHVENISVHRNLLVPVEMRGSRVKSSDALKYSLPQYPYELKPPPEKVLNTHGISSERRDSLIRMIGLIVDSGCIFEEKDAALIKKFLEMNNIPKTDEIWNKVLIPK